MRGHKDGAAGGCRFSAFQDEGSGAALQLVREYLDDAAIVHLVQGFFPHPLHGLVDTEGSDTVRCIKVNILRGQTYDLALSQCAHQRQVDSQMQDGVLHAADIGDNEILDGGKVGFVGLGCPLVFAALLWQPIHEELCHRHRGRDQKSVVCLFLYFNMALCYNVKNGEERCT